MFIRYNLNLKSRARELRNNQTDSERLVWNYLRKEFSNFSFLRQKPLGEFIADFYCYQLSLIIEIDWDVHDFQKEKDHERDLVLLEKFNLKTLRFSNGLVNNNILSIKKELLEYIRTCGSPSL